LEEKMPLYRIDNGRIEEIASMPSNDMLERQIEDILVNSKLKLLNGQELLIIGRQITTSTDKRMDILAIDSDGRLVVVELKRGMAPRDTIAQIVDYASWLSSIPHKDIEKIFRENNQNKTLSVEFKTLFGEEIETSEEIIMYVVAQDFPEEVYNSANFLSRKGVAIICKGFDVFKENDKVIYLHTKDMAGEIEEFSEKRKAKNVSSFKSHDFQCFQGLQKILEEKYGEWLSTLGLEKIHPFELWQNKKIGDPTSTYVDFAFDSKSKITVEVLIERENNSACLSLGIWCRNKKNDIFKKLIQEGEVKKLAEKAGMKLENDGWGLNLQYANKEGFLNDSDGIINENVTTKLILDQFERAKPVIEAVLKK
jgi:hypothetical protein